MVQTTSEDDAETVRSPDAEFDAKAMEVLNSIPGTAWKRFAELGECSVIIGAISAALREAYLQGD